METVAFDDINGLHTRISDTFGPWSGSYTVTQATIDGYAEMTGDDQWIHVDVDRARRESPYGVTIAQGFLTVGLLSKAPAPLDWKVVNNGSAANYGVDGLRFLAPVPAGSAIRSRRRLADVVARGTGTLLTWAYEIAVVDSDRPAVVVQLKVLYRP